MQNNIELEGKILNIDITKMTDRIVKIGGKQIGNYTFRRYVFEVIPHEKGKWVRLRTDGDKTTLALKEIKNDSIDGTSEWEVAVSNFEDTLTILKKSGLVPKCYQENKRLEFAYKGVTIALDSWPMIPPYMEIEGSSKKEVFDVVKDLGYKLIDLTGKNTKDIYLDHGYDIDKIASLKF